LYWDCLQGCLQRRCKTFVYGNIETANEQVYETLDITSELTRLVVWKFCITTQNCFFVKGILQISDVLSFYWYLAVSSLVRGFRCWIFKDNNKEVECKCRKFFSKVAAEYWWILNLMKVLKSKDSGLLRCCTVSTGKRLPIFRIVDIDTEASRCLNLQHYRYENLKSRVLKPAGNNLPVQ